jgi:Pentapeptide repeats (8 copies)/LeuA allosteric (dimerisation) domain
MNSNYFDSHNLSSSSNSERAMNFLKKGWSTAENNQVNKDNHIDLKLDYSPSFIPTTVTENDYDDLEPVVKIMLNSDLLINYMAEKDDSKLNPYVHEILRLTYLEEIVCYVFEEDIDLAFSEITNKILHYLANKYFSKVEAKKNLLEVVGLRDKVLAKIKKVISNDIIIYKRKDVLIDGSPVKSQIGYFAENSHDIPEENMSDSDLQIKLDLPIKVEFHRQMRFTSIVVNSHKSLTHLYNDLNVEGLNIRVDNPKSFVESYMAGFSCTIPENTDKINEISADDISEVSEGFDQVAALNKLIEVEPIYEPFLINELENEISTDDIPEINKEFSQVVALIKLIGARSIYKPLLIKELGEGWYFIDFQVMTTEKSAVIAKIKLWNKEYDRNFIFTGTGNGVIDAILSAVDDTVKYMTEQNIIKKVLPNKSKIFSFLLNDHNNDVKAKVECKIIFEYHDKYYIARGNHSDTVKSVLYAYVSVLANILDDNYCKKNYCWIEDNEMIQYLYFNKSIKDFKHLKGIDLVLRGGEKNLSKEMYFDFSNFNSIHISQDNHQNSSWFKVRCNEVTLSKSCFHHTDFSKTGFHAATVICCKFTETKMQHIKWSSSTIIDTEMSGIVLTNADLSHAKLYNVNLTGADLTDVNLNDADFKNVNLTNAVLNGTQLKNVNLSEAILTGTCLA